MPSIFDYKHFFDDYCKELSLVDYIKNIKFEMAKDNIDFSKNNGISKLESIIKLINSTFAHKTKLLFGMNA